jgi:hypothetical protein
VVYSTAFCYLDLDTSDGRGHDAGAKFTANTAQATEDLDEIYFHLILVQAVRSLLHSYQRLLATPVLIRRAYPGLTCRAMCPSTRHTGLTAASTSAKSSIGGQQYIQPSHLLSWPPEQGLCINQHSFRLPQTVSSVSAETSLESSHTSILISGPPLNSSSPSF